MPPPLYANNCQYTPSGTAVGTQTLNPGPEPNPGPGQGLASPQTHGVLYGYVMNAAGTAGMGITFLDIYTYVAQGTGTQTQTNTIISGTLTANGATLQGPNGLGIRYRGALVLVTSGTVGAGNSLWD